MIHRRKFFAKCAAFVAGCALGVGIERKAPACAVIRMEVTPLTKITPIDPNATPHSINIMGWHRLESGKMTFGWHKLTKEEFKARFPKSIYMINNP